MRRAFIAPTLIAVILVLGACEESLVAPTEVEPDLAVVEHGRETVDVFEFGDPPVPVAGASWIRRGHRGIRAVIRTSQLERRHAYTAWLVIFNQPEGCSDECGEDDLFNPDAQVDIVYLSGRISNRRGRVTLSGRRSVNDHSGSLFALLDVPAPGLVDPIGAEVHVIVRDHGPPVRGQVRKQLRTFEGGCTPESSFDLGDGSYECVDVQFAVHLPE